MILTAVLAHRVSMRQHRATEEDSVRRSLLGNYEVGDKLRDELREDLKQIKAEQREERAEFVRRVTDLQSRLAAAEREAALLKRMRCPRHDCPVFIANGAAT